MMFSGFRLSGSSSGFGGDGVVLRIGRSQVRAQKPTFFWKPGQARGQSFGMMREMFPVTGSLVCSKSTVAEPSGIPYSA